MPLAVGKISTDAAHESRNHRAENGDICRQYGDPLLEKRDGIFRHACLNAGNFTTENEDSTKFGDLCEMTRKCDTDAMSTSEHGLNPLKLKPSQSDCKVSSNTRGQELCMTKIGLIRLQECGEEQAL